MKKMLFIFLSLGLLASFGSGHTNLADPGDSVIGLDNEDPDITGVG